jgi:hypothetical protein
MCKNIIDLANLCCFKAIKAAKPLLAARKEISIGQTRKRGKPNKSSKALINN